MLTAEMTRTDLVSAVYSLAHACPSMPLVVGDAVWVFHKVVHDDYASRGPLNRAVVTEVTHNGKAVEVEYPDGGRERLKRFSHAGCLVAKADGA